MYGNQFEAINNKILKERIESNSNLVFIGCEYKNQNSKIQLKCTCGNIFEASYRKLRENNYKTLCKQCRIDMASETTFKNNKEKAFKFVESIKYYKLIKYGKGKAKSMFYHEKCNSCFEMRYDTFFDGARCSCEVNSRGARRISEILDSKHIEYVTEFTFDDCRGINDGLLRFDFYIQSNNLIIEYDGEFHYKEMQLRNSDLVYQQKHDEIKNKYCKDKDLRLLRIPYWEFDNIEELLNNALY